VSPLTPRPPAHGRFLGSGTAHEWSRVLGTPERCDALGGSIRVEWVGSDVSMTIPRLAAPSQRSHSPSCLAPGGRGRTSRARGRARAAPPAWPRSSSPSAGRGRTGTDGIGVDAFMTIPRLAALPLAALPCGGGVGAGSPVACSGLAPAGTGDEKNVFADRGPGADRQVRQELRLPPGPSHVRRHGRGRDRPMPPAARRRERNGGTRLELDASMTIPRLAALATLPFALLAGAGGAGADLPGPGPGPGTGAGGSPGLPEIVFAVRGLGADRHVDGNSGCRRDPRTCGGMAGDGIGRCRPRRDAGSETGGGDRCRTHP